jgi:sRNA-binding regulator protein Hfq
MSFTIGTALLDARDNQFPVELLVEGHWIHGEVAAVDGFGVVLSREATQHSVIRIESIAAINVDEDRSTIPTQRQDTAASRHMAIAR